ncbi:hypothetical protein [Endozoicomonas sp. 4G]|uniref:hypothetical protein n=1 Tax=Endozoicomonas sp. 4G TaxID=2872754 RepID=UPI002078BD36|nr:hypothetical protein [Endozoicomonas sp. 4G]
MKVKFRFILLLLLFLLSSFSSAKNLLFKWKLEQQGNLIVHGVTSTSNQVIHSNAITGCDQNSSDLDRSIRYCIACSGADFVIYEVATITRIFFDENIFTTTPPEPFDTLLGGGGHPLQHSLNTRYLLRGQTTTAVRNTAHLLSCMLCCPLFLAFEMCTRSMSREYENEIERFRALEIATPNHLPEHVTIHKRSLSHSAISLGGHEHSSSTTELTDKNTHIFDLFLNTPETQQWIIEHLNPEHLKLELIIPELFDTATPATIIVQEQSGELTSRSLQPSHIVSLTLANGINVLYHLKLLSSQDVQVLAVVVSAHDYTLTMTVDNYDVPTTPSPSNNSELIESCNCNGACNCQNPQNNNTDDSESSIETISIETDDLFFIPPVLDAGINKCKWLIF